MAKTNNTTDPNAINIICDGTIIKGDINTDGDIRFDGILNGNLNAKGKFVAGNTGTVKGEITCNNAEIQGHIEGKIKVSELLTLRHTSTFKGDITTKQLAIEPGAIFNGVCQMNGNSGKEAIAEK